MTTNQQGPPQSGDSELTGSRVSGLFVKSEDNTGENQENSSLLNRLRQLEDESYLTPYEADMKDPFPEMTADPDEFAATLNLAEPADLPEIYDVESAIFAEEDFALEEKESELELPSPDSSAEGEMPALGIEMLKPEELVSVASNIDVAVEETIMREETQQIDTPVAVNGTISGREIIAQIAGNVNGYQYDEHAQINFAGILKDGVNWATFSEQLKNINLEIIAAGRHNLLSAQQTRTAASSLIDAIIEANKPQPSRSAVLNHVNTLHKTVMGKTNLLGLAFDLNLAACVINQLN